MKKLKYFTVISNLTVILAEVVKFKGIRGNAVFLKKSKSITNINKTVIIIKQFLKIDYIIIPN